ncbi:MAG: NADPH-dependent 7-cyano-7-deazaguanine reductase QueF [Geopsychrobacter sp.]|nr:NADPH-dependent 7-cyano-7-deazaguanine reductase QueF [Geopsychrobacter sp.]
MNDYSQHIPLGKATAYVSQYDPTLLCPFPRQLKRTEIGVSKPLPFSGTDLWNGYELSWLNSRGLPQVAMARFFFDCESPFLIESKSFKLYLNSFNQTALNSWTVMQQTLVTDLSVASGRPVGVELMTLDDAEPRLSVLPGDCLDDLDLPLDNYQLQPAGLKADADSPVAEILHSHLLKSNCLVTNQPDWGSVLIEYRGARIDREALLRYLISFRQHNEFHEQCVERIFVDIKRYCQPQELSVQAWYTRRGGLDINPFRTNCAREPRLLRLVRQ